MANRRNPRAASLPLDSSKSTLPVLPSWMGSRSVGNGAAELRVAYQGVSGAYSELAARTALPGCATLPCPVLYDAVLAVKAGHADRAVLPVEGTTDACAVRNYDILLQNDLHIVQEVSLFVDYYLLAMPGVGKKGLRKVISHPMALEHCGRSLRRLGLDQEPVDDTAGAVKMLLARGMVDTAAIASPRAAALYGLDVLVRGLQDEAWNVTRFLVLSRSPGQHKSGTAAKTSIVVAGRGGALAALLKVLSACSRRGISLRKLEVHNPGAHGDGMAVLVLDADGRGTLRAFPHVLYVDLEGSVEDERVKDAMADISSFSELVRVLGCYTADPKIYDLRS
ncbi:hypothetical protein Taro_016100 [Colocasia esculenta]|uniref:prephenate dehydratase n=1 Tax=Colocasia esculenta TaxID=4460 RepID=A0A843UV83_COLES|nr:hypothetical protein [Colocasia esculenta]